MQNQPQNPNNHLNNHPQLKSEQVSYIIEVSIENPDCVAFVQWLRSKGHSASIIDSECSFINGMPGSLDRYYFIYKELYSSFLSTKATSKALDIFEQCDTIFKEMIAVPIGHKYSWDNERKTAWWLNASGDSLSAYIEREQKDDDDTKQFYAEFRIFTESKRPSGLLFIDYEDLYAEKNQNHNKIEEEFYGDLAHILSRGPRATYFRRAESYEDLAHKLSNIFNDVLKEHIV